MDYIYDIALNFQDEYYDFYEWHPSDKIISVKRIPIYMVSSKDYLLLKNNDVTIDVNTIPHKSKIFAITSGIEIMGLYINKHGRVIKKSSLIFEEADDILKDKDEIKKVNIKYKINKTNRSIILSRLTKEKMNYIDRYLNNIDKVKDEYLLKYIYYDIYNEEENNLDAIAYKLHELAKKDISKLYDSIIKIKYELKKLS